MQLLRHTGFFSQKEIKVNGKSIRPIDLTAKLLFPQWEMNKDDRDLTIMQVQVIGMKNGKKISHTFDLLDLFDETTNTHSMARTTGYTATVIARMIAAGLYNRTGLSVPEYIGQDARAVDFLLKGLEERGVIYKEWHTGNRLKRPTGDRYFLACLIREHQDWVVPITCPSLVHHNKYICQGST